MKKTIIRVCLFVAAFLFSVAAASRLLGRENTDMTSDMALPELPLVYLDVDGMRVNMMQGYLGEMDLKTMRDGIIAVGSDRELSVCVQKEQAKITSLSYEVRSLDASRLVESTEITDYEEDGDLLTADIVLKDLIDAGTEYTLVFKVTLSDERVASYYTRLIQADDYEQEDKLAFVSYFSDTTFDKENISELSEYMESSGDNASLASVTINSSLSQLAWGELQVERVTEPVYTIRNLTSETATITMDYLVSYERDGSTRLSIVNEVYRIRSGSERYYLLDYERSMEELLEEEGDCFNEDELVLGLTDTELEMVESEDGKVVAFEQGGVVYALNMTENKLSRLYCGYDREEADERALLGRDNIQLLMADEAGNVWFVVSGYISRGRWEGYVGSVVYYYDSSANTTEELAFLSSSEAPEILKAQVERLGYINGKNEWYFLIHDKVCCIHLDDPSLEVMAEGVSLDGCQVSDSNRMIVWQNEGEKYASTSLTLMNLSTGESTVIEAGNGNYILPLGFMEEDLIYGLARQSDVTADSTGITMFPMYQVRIQDETGETLMSYAKDGVYVVDATLNGNQIILSRVKKEEDTYVSCEEDQIVSGQEASSSRNQVGTTTDDELGQITVLSLRSSVDGQTLIFQTPKEVLYEGSRELEPGDFEGGTECYYVYSMRGEVTLASTPAEAVELAYASSGLVVAEDGTCLWRKEKQYTKNQIMAIEAHLVEEGESELSVCLDAILSYEGVTRNTAYLMEQGQTVKQILEENLEEVIVLDLEGASLESVLYYPDQEIPVLAVLKDQSSVLIVGFNEQNVVLMDPGEGEIYKMGLNDAAEWFEENGNVFLTYVHTS